MIRSICHLMASREQGCMERHVADLSRWQARNTDAEIAVITHPRYREPLDSKVRFVPLNTDRSQHHPDLVWRLANQLRAGGFQVAHGHGSKSAQLLAAVQSYTDLKQVITRHNVRHPRDRLASAFDARIAVSQAAVANSRLAWRVIPNGIDPTPVAAAKDFPRANLLLLNRLTKSNHLELLLQALVEVPGTNLTVAAGGLEESRLKSACAELGIRERVLFAGAPASQAAILRAADLLVIPSRGEESPYLLTEALVNRCPVLSRRVGNAEDFLPDQLLLDSDAPQEIAAGIRFAVSGQSALRTMLAASFSRAAQQLTLDSMATATWEIYREIPGGGLTPPVPDTAPRRVQ